MLGLNTGSAIFMVEASSKNLGTILHVNDEVEFQLGYQRSELLGKKINCIMPDAVNQLHNGFLMRYLETGK